MLGSITVFFEKACTENALGDFIFNSLSDESCDRQMEDHGGYPHLISLSVTHPKGKIREIELLLRGDYRHHLVDRAGIGYDAYVDFYYVLDVRKEEDAVRLTGVLFATAFVDPVEEKKMIFSQPKKIADVALIYSHAEFGSNVLFD
jgi:hypothetical protein